MVADVFTALGFLLLFFTLVLFAAALLRDPDE